MLSELTLKEGWTTVFLLLLVLLCVAWSIQALGLSDGLAILQAVVVVGGILGIVLAKSRVPNRLAHVLALLAGITWAGFLTARVLAGQLDITTEAAVSELTMRLGDWLLVVISKRTGPGNYAYLLLLSLMLWVLSYYSAWAIFRWQRVWLAVIVCGATLMVSITYAPRSMTGFLIAFLLLALLLVVRVNIALREQEWKVSDVGYSPELVFSFLRAGLVIAVLGIMLAWLAPAALASRPMQPFWDTVSEPWRDLQNEWNRVFHGLNYENDAALISLPRATRFSGVVELTDTPVLDIRATSGRYWRVMVFHEYTSDGWNNTDPDIVQLEENDDALTVPEFGLRREVTQTVMLRQNLYTHAAIVAAGHPVLVGLPSQALASSLAPAPSGASLEENHEAPTDLGDPSVFYTRKALPAGQSYTVVSAVASTDQESLSEAGTVYPDWVVPRYLDLPGTLPERVGVLAQEVTEESETPYEKAVAIERYLRRIPYNEQIPGPEQGQDGVDYFLFEQGEGYCDYYSSAMVVMLRSVGVPARYVRGYSQGQKEQGVFQVREWDSHAWPEVFFPGYGWIEFEPTGGEPALVRPVSQNNQTQAGNYNPPLPESERDALLDREEPGVLGPNPDLVPDSLAPLPLWGWLVLGVAALLATVATVILAVRRSRIVGMTAVERVYYDLVNWSRRLLRIEPKSHQTPHEYAGAVAWAVPKGRRPIERIADLYVAEKFGAKDVASSDAEEAWRSTLLALSRQWLERRTNPARHAWNWWSRQVEGSSDEDQSG
jgi:transglutaminase-like putative cysteine protease